MCSTVCILGRWCLQCVGDWALDELTDPGWSRWAVTPQLTSPWTLERPRVDTVSSAVAPRKSPFGIMLSILHWPKVFGIASTVCHGPLKGVVHPQNDFFPIDYSCLGHLSSTAFFVFFGEFTKNRGECMDVNEHLLLFTRRARATQVLRHRAVSHNGIDKQNR